VEVIDAYNSTANGGAAQHQEGGDSGEAQAYDCEPAQADTHSSWKAGLEGRKVAAHLVTAQ
jgi:hypothetical protein